jgi:hypothetical protein
MSDDFKKYFDQAKKEGLSFIPTPTGITVRGEKGVVSRWMPLLRENRESLINLVELYDEMVAERDDLYRFLATEPVQP